MESLELTVEQCRFIAAIRARSPRAVVEMHDSRDGIILEVRQGRRVQLARLDSAGRIRHDRHVRVGSPRHLAAAPPQSPRPDTAAPLPQPRAA